MLPELRISRVDSLCTLEKYQTETTAKDMTFGRAFNYHVFILQNYISMWIFLFIIMFAFIVVIWFFDFSLFGEFEKYQYCYTYSGFITSHYIGEYPGCTIVIFCHY